MINFDVEAHLPNKLFISSGVTVGSQRLLQKSQQNRDNDARLESLPKTDEKDYIIRINDDSHLSRYRL